MSEKIQQQFYRVFLSISDMEKCIKYLKAAKQADKVDEWDAMGGLIAAGIVAYGRPFSGNEPHESATPTPPFSEKALTQDQRLVHEKLLTLRHKVIAHSDAEMNPAEFLNRESNSILVASAIYDPRREWESIDIFLEAAFLAKRIFEEKAFELNCKIVGCRE